MTGRTCDAPPGECINDHIGPKLGAHLSTDKVGRINRQWQAF